MRAELEEAVCDVLREVHAEFGELADAELVAATKTRFLDRWYRFAPFGLTSRSQLEAMAVAVTWVDELPPGINEEAARAWFGAEWDQKRRVRRTTVNFRNTPLAKHWHG